VVWETLLEEVDFVEEVDLLPHHRVKMTLAMPFEDDRFDNYLLVQV